MRAPGSGCDCGDEARCGRAQYGVPAANYRVPFADTFLVRSRDRASTSAEEEPRLS